MLEVDAKWTKETSYDEGWRCSCLYLKLSAVEPTTRTLFFLPPTNCQRSSSSPNHLRDSRIYHCRHSTSYIPASESRPPHSLQSSAIYKPRCRCHSRIKLESTTLIYPVLILRTHISSIISTLHPSLATAILPMHWSNLCHSLLSSISCKPDHLHGAR